MMKNNHSPSLSDQTYSQIKNDIVTCLLVPGQMIVQNDLVEKYQVGITPVREALHRLAQEGYIQSVPRLGYVVSQITRRDIEEIYELRLILETSSSVLAANRGKETDLSKILESADFTYVYHDRQSYSSFLKKNAEFHVSIAACTFNRRLIYQVSKTMDELSRVFHLGLDLKDSAEEMREDHLSIAKAIYNREETLVETLIREEIIRSRTRVMVALEKIEKEAEPSPFFESSIVSLFSRHKGSENEK